MGVVRLVGLAQEAGDGSILGPNLKALSNFGGCSVLRGCQYYPSQFYGCCCTLTGQVIVSQVGLCHKREVDGGVEK